ncbi:MAG: hypothetical protein RLZZ380_264 [Actinomycetota bacterium]|jgi:deoxyribodipyrimidine photo-lyase
MPNIFWFRRDLRISDHPALNAALSDGPTILVASADLLGSKFSLLSEIRRNSLRASWSSLSKSLNNRLSIVENVNELLKLAKFHGVEKVFASTAYDTNGVKEMNAVAKDLNAIGAELILGPGNYAVAPGSVRKGDGTPYRVYTPFYNEWAKNDFGQSTTAPSLENVLAPVETSFDPQLEFGADIKAGESFAVRTLERFLDGRVDGYQDDRNRADLGGTSHLSHALSHGEIHPRTILERLEPGAGADVFRKEIAWREFYADVLWHNPHTLTGYLDSKYAGMEYNFDEQVFARWCQGETGYPMVDAGMRQLLSDGWMHNRVRMIVASFLIKDLHFEWQHGARWFEENLTDFDPASNSHGWQWTAGCGTDASPYYRVFNPVLQGLKFDPHGDYVRKYIPELRHLQGSSAHEPWNQVSGYSNGYPKQIVDHSEERNESLRRLDALKNS